MAGTLVKAAVVFLIGALLALGKRRFQQKASLQNISKVVHVLHHGRGLKLQRQKAGDGTKVEDLNPAGFEESDNIEFLQQKYFQLFFEHNICHVGYERSENQNCRWALYFAAEKLRRAWTNIFLLFPSEYSLILAKRTWSENMKALLHKYAEEKNDDRLVENIMMLELSPGDGFVSIRGGLDLDNKTVQLLNGLLDGGTLNDHNDVKLLALKELWYARQGYLDAATTQMTQWVEKQTYGLKVKIFPTGSKTLTSDQDVQMAMDLCGGWTVDTIKVVADVVAWIRTVSSGIVSLFGSDATIVLERLYDINFYPPTLFNYIPRTCTKKFDRKRFYYGTGEDQETVAFRLETNAFGSKSIYTQPEESNGILIEPEETVLEKATLPFLKIDSVRAAHNFENTRTNEFLQEWKATTAPGLHVLLQAARDGVAVQDKDWNLKMLDLTAPNTIGPEMYLSICTMLYVVWHMQSKNQIEAEVIPLLSMVSALENLVHYRNTRKDKYRERVCEPYRNHLATKGYVAGSIFRLSAQTFDHVEHEVASASTSSQVHPQAEIIVETGILSEMDDLCNSMNSSWSWPTFSDVVQYVKGSTFDKILRDIQFATLSASNEI